MTSHLDPTTVAQYLSDNPHFFEENPEISEIAARDLMPLFIKKGIFLQDHRNGFPIRILLNELNREGKLQLFRHTKVERRTEESAWYFTRVL